jgi:RNA polymerase sigma-70 factor (ECF subfamily)
MFADDRELLVAYRAGRRDALERVYRTYARDVDFTLRTLARASGYAEISQTNGIADLLQEVFVRAFSPAARNAYDGIRDFKPYLLTIARNCFLDALRAMGREIPRRSEELALALDADVTELDGWADPRVVAAVDGFLRTLPAAVQGVCEQRFVLGRSQAEVSAALGLSRGEIRTSERRLRRGLRKALVQAGISLEELRQPHEDSSTRIPVPAVLQRGRF